MPQASGPGLGGWRSCRSASRAGPEARRCSAWLITSQAAAAVSRPVASRTEPSKALQQGLSQSFGVHGPLDMSANVAASGSEGLFGGAHAARMLNEP